MNCDGTENTIEECGGVVELDSCPCAPASHAYGWLQCQPGKSLIVEDFTEPHHIMYQTLIC